MAAQNQPDKEFRAGTVTAAIWRNEVEKDGRTVVQHTVRVQKRYRDASGEWKTTEYFFPNDLPKLRLVVEKAFEHVSLKGSEEPF